MSDTDVAEPAYSYRASAMGAPRAFRLSGNGLYWDTGRRSGHVSYGSIRRVRMAYRPAGMQSKRFTTEIWSGEAPKLTIISTSVRGLFELMRQDREYREFLRALHARLAASENRRSYETGLPLYIFGPGIVVFAAAAIGIAALTVRAISEGAAGAALIVGAFLGLFLWQAGAFFGRNRPGRYQPDALPENLLPPN
jgi:hypothetical protein